MAIRKTPFAFGEFYHIYSRGVDKRIIFLDEDDRLRFVRLLFLCNGSEAVVYKNVKNKSLKDINVGTKLVSIGAYCLMPNHFHLLIKEIREGGTTEFMRKLLTAYSAYFNKKYERTGSLFGSRFKSSHLDSDEYLKYIFAYIHLNPLKIFDSHWRERIVEKEWVRKTLRDYRFSSYLDYLNRDNAEEGLILNKTEFPKYFPTPEDFEEYVCDWINFNMNMHQGPSLAK